MAFVFALRDRVVGEYHDYFDSFVNTAECRIYWRSHRDSRRADPGGMQKGRCDSFDFRVESGHGPAKRRMAGRRRRTRMPARATSRRAPESAEDERRNLARAEELLKGRRGALPRVTMDVEGQQVELPGSAVQHLRRLISRLARGQEVAVFTLQESLTTQEAADLLHVSRPYLIGVLDRGLIPYYRLKSHRRIRLEDLLAFRTRLDAERQEALNELTRLSQEAGLYDE